MVAKISINALNDYPLTLLCAFLFSRKNKNKTDKELWKYQVSLLYSVLLGMNMLTRDEPCLDVSVCVFVCLSVYLCVSPGLYFPQFSADFDETLTLSPYQKFEMTLFSKFENVALMTSHLLLLFFNVIKRLNFSFSFFFLTGIFCIWCHCSLWDCKQ